MGSDTRDFQLETHLELLHSGDNIDMVADVLFTGPGFSVCKSIIHQQIFYSDVPIKTPQGTITILQAKFDQIKDKYWLMNSHNTVLISHGSLTQQSVYQLVEACAGIGAVGLGFKTCGFNTIVQAEMNPTYCKWLADHGHSSVVQGDVADASAIRAIADHCKGPPSLTAGFSCQPFSNLGDKLEEKDSRSAALTSVLKLGHYIRAPIIILECTKGAMTSKWVQKVLKQFQSETGFSLHQQVMDLHYLWPSCRTRWWAVLAAPFLNMGNIPDLPSIGWSPGILHLMPKLLDMSPDELQQLELSPYELRYFHSMGQGIGSHIINLAKALPTATHSWGSQVLPCHCGCRKSGFTMERLDGKGLYGILVPLGKTVVLDNEELSTFRHPHPQEVALLNGCSPSLVKSSKKNTVRLDLSGIGQLASPLQAAWICANVLECAFKQGLVQTPIKPIDKIKQICRELFQERNQLLGVSQPSTYMTIFENAINNLGENHKESTHDPEHHGSFTQALLEVVKKAEGKIDMPVEFPKKEVTYEKSDEVELIAPLDTESITGKSSEHTTHQAEKVTPDGNTSLPLQDPDPHVLDRWCEKDSCFGLREVLPLGKTEEDIPLPEAYSCSGGVQLFATKDSTEEPPIKKQKFDVVSNGDIPKLDHAIEISPTIPWTTEAIGNTYVNNLGNTHPKTFWIGHPNEGIFQSQFTGSPTIGQATQAEAKLHNTPVTIKPMSGVGTDLSLSQPLQEDDVILIRQCGECDKDKCFRSRSSHQFSPDGNGAPRFEGNLSREELLWNQRGWVASDEMTFYLETMKSNGNIMTSPPLYFEDETSQIVVWGDWVVKASEIAAASNQQFEISSVIWHDHHWFPVRLEIKEQSFSITTTPIESDLLHHLSKEAFGDYEFVLQSLDIHHKFPADCGFQSLAWLTAVASDDPTKTWMDAADALALRKQFAQHLKDNALHNKQCSLVRLGGMNHSNITKELQSLLESHGVSNHRSREHAQHVIERLSIGEIAKTLQAPRPWADLKAKANALKPQLQLVLSEELKTAIDSRLREGKSFGHKQTKQSTNSIAQTNIRLNAAHVQVPPGIFQQTDGTKLSQINPMQINPQAKGFAVVNIDDALPFFDIRDPIGKAGIALMILDHQDQRLPERCSTIRFPAQYAETDEPVIVTAAILQLGQQLVQRFVPETCAKIDEVSTAVVRAMIYKDQYKEYEWSTFRDHPVRCLMEQPAFQQLPKQAIIDVWDRQFLGKNFKKTKAQDADMFIVTLRVEHKFAPDLMEISGEDGIYIEPRDDSGRQPHQNYKVIWLPKASFGDLVVAKQKTEGQSWLARNGDRYGIRVEAEHEQHAHQLHRPEVDFIGGELKHFRVGPLPFGTNKSSLSKAFKQWGWPARAGQPLTQTRDHTGVFWSAQAAQNPSHWIFTMMHGDVLIAQLPSKEEVAKPSQSVVASSRTLKQITMSGKPSTEHNAPDPWLKDDPWAPKAPQAKPLSVSQVAAMENNIEKRIRASITSSASTDDSAMESVLDDRVTQMEMQMKHLQDSFGNFQNQQQAHNVQVAHELTTVRSQVDAQTTGFQQILADKLEEQMAKIDALLNKRPRNE